jgi:hypothetical protein
MFDLDFLLSGLSSDVCVLPIHVFSLHNAIVPFALTAGCSPSVLVFKPKIVFHRNPHKRSRLLSQLADLELAHQAVAVIAKVVD